MRKLSFIYCPISFFTNHKLSTITSQNKINYTKEVVWQVKATIKGVNRSPAKTNALPAKICKIHLKRPFR